MTDARFFIHDLVFISMESSLSESRRRVAKSIDAGRSRPVQLVIQTTKRFAKQTCE